MVGLAGRKRITAVIRLIAVASISSVVAIPCTVAAQSETASEFWPTVNAKIGLPHKWRALIFTGLKKGEENQHQQLNAGVGLGRQLRPIIKPHSKNADPDKEHTFVLGAGYERLQLFRSGTRSNEDRLVLQATSAFRPTALLYLSDRNRVECRWRDSGYSTRYRNTLQALYDVVIRGFHFSPYGSAEFFYDGARGEWSREQYTAGLEWPLRSKLTLQTYYLRQNNTTNPRHLNVGGVTLNLNLNFK